MAGWWGGVVLFLLIRALGGVLCRIRGLRRVWVVVGWAVRWLVGACVCFLIGWVVGWLVGWVGRDGEVMMGLVGS